MTHEMPASIAPLTDALRQRLADGMPVDAALDALDADANSPDLDAQVDAWTAAQARLRKAALDALTASQSN